jgi:hypothetical protein
MIFLDCSRRAARPRKARQDDPAGLSCAPRRPFLGGGAERFPPDHFTPPVLIPRAGSESNPPHGYKVRLGFEAPPSVTIMRGEVLHREKGDRAGETGPAPHQTPAGTA